MSTVEIIETQTTLEIQDPTGTALVISETIGATLILQPDPTSMLVLSQGIVGPTGPQGEKGDKGDTGEVDVATLVLDCGTFN